MACALRAIFAAALIVALSFAAPVAADPYEDAVAAYNREDYATAHRLLLPLANQGLAKAQVNLGLLYFYGQGVSQDDAEAEKWFRMAAGHGDALAQHNLGVMYDTGRGVPQDQVEALKWYRKAADQGLADGQYDLGQKYASGHGVPRDYVRALMWFNLAAAQGHQYAAMERASITPLMTRAQINEAQELAREWKPITPAQR
jgi:TPR repeat protein